MRAKLCLACAPFDMSPQCETLSQTGENVAQWVEMEYDKWGITEDVGVVTTDTAANMLKMMDYLPIHFLHCGCFNHIPFNDVELFEKQSIKSLIKKCRHIYTYGNQSVQVSQCVVTKQMEAGNAFFQPHIFHYMSKSIELQDVFPI